MLYVYVFCWSTASSIQTSSGCLSLCPRGTLCMSLAANNELSYIESLMAEKMGKG